MVELVPRPFSALVSRAFTELSSKQAIYDLPARKFFKGDPAHDLSTRFHGRRASTPLGPAAGPHSQLAQNIVLAWLGGSRIIELKTVQIKDRLEIPRPCIDMRKVGFNIEWSQELRLEQSLEEYVKASMLIEMLCQSSELGLEPGFDAVRFDMSVGYDLAGIRSERVQAFIRGMLDAGEIVERLRSEIPSQFARFRDLPFETRLSDTLTLSTFHGCPPDEIERIIEFLMRELGLCCVIKLNPTLLGRDEVDRLLHEELGFDGISVPETAFTQDTTFAQAVGFVERLHVLACELGLSLGVKFSNTLVVEHDGEFLPATEKQKYLSGRPLHVLAMHLVGRFRERFGNGVPISFSAGIDRHNFADAVALGLTPITVCSDLLAPGGYGRLQGYLRELGRRMDELGARDIEDFIMRTAAASGAGRAKDRDAAIACNTRAYVARLASDPRYAQAAHATSPKKLGSRLTLFDCVTCDKCVPVCPNDANFVLQISPREIEVPTVAQVDGAFQAVTRRTLVLSRGHQIASFADSCNECGNCDVFCPEDGGPFLEKPRFFGSLQAWQKFAQLDGFCLERRAAAQHVFARLAGEEYRLSVEGRTASFSGQGFELEFDRGDPIGAMRGRADRPVDMEPYHVMELLREAVFESGDVNWVNVGQVT